MKDGLNLKSKQAFIMQCIGGWLGFVQVVRCLDLWACVTVMVLLLGSMWCEDLCLLREPLLSMCWELQILSVWQIQIHVRWTDSLGEI